MDFNSVIMVVVGLLVSIVAYFLQRLVKTLDRIDSNVSQHTTEIVTIKQSIAQIPSIENKVEGLFTDFAVLKSEHDRVHCHRR